MTNMVSGGGDGVGAITETPQMAAADPLTDEYVLAWLQTGPGAQDKGIFARAEELREALLKHGYGSLAGLRVLTEDELKQVKVGTKTIPAGIRALAKGGVSAFGLFFSFPNPLVYMFI